MFVKYFVGKGSLKTAKQVRKQVVGDVKEKREQWEKTKSEIVKEYEDSWRNFSKIPPRKKLEKGEKKK